ncbi:hypothetical protein ACSBR1_036738 [Camellia fascicularis]
MGMKEALPFLGMVSIQFIQVGMIVAVKEATSHGLTKFTFVFYSNSLAALILLPTSFLLHRSTRPPITFSLLCKLFVISLLGCTSQIVGNVAVQITPASFSTAIMNLVPGFTFTLAVIFRLEQADFKSSSTLAKSIGTIVSIVGALIVTLYKGPSLLMTATQYNLVLGAFLLTIECLSSSAYVITQLFRRNYDWNFIFGYGKRPGRLEPTTFCEVAFHSFLRNCWFYNTSKHSAVVSAPEGASFYCSVSPLGDCHFDRCRYHHLW